MTTDWPRRQKNWARAAGILRLAVLVWLLPSPWASAQSPLVQHWLHAGALPPGAIGDLRRQISSPLSGYFQPVRIRVPEGTRIALVGEGADPQPGDQLVGLQIGPVYRLRVTQLLNGPGVELYPTIELIDRLYPPPRLAQRYPIPIELTQEELQMAAEGMFVTRVIYLEDPHQALADAQDPQEEQPWTEAPQGADPLVVADELGRPMAILRIGSRIPREGDERFNYGNAPAIRYDVNDE